MSRCGWHARGRKCRQPVAFKVTAPTWVALVCLNHLGPLCLRGFDRVDHVLVEPVEVTS